ncbi:MAG: MBL fold metallo-hydrolase [Bdellovibrionales bacterium]|nr:MBL fold metallo-hydrolase [Bdellovibrionales bacterium]
MEIDRPKRGGRRLWLLGLLLLPGVVLHQLGWFREMRPWQEASGFTALPADLQPSPYTPGPDEARIAWLGHAGFLIELAGVRLLTDPNLSEQTTISRRVMLPPLRAQELGPIDAVLLSHSHYDHLDLPTLEQLAAVETLILPDGSERFLSQAVRLKSRVVGLQVGEEHRIGPVEIVAVPAVHNGHRFHPFSSTLHALGYVIRTEHFSLFFAGDTGWGPHFTAIREQYRPDAVILPIGGYLPYFVLRHYHLSPEDAVRAAEELGVRYVIPGHFGTFRVAFDLPESPLPIFARVAANKGVVWHLPPMATKVTQ